MADLDEAIVQKLAGLEHEIPEDVESSFLQLGASMSVGEPVHLEESTAVDVDGKCLNDDGSHSPVAFEVQLDAQLLLPKDGDRVSDQVTKGSKGPDDGSNGVAERNPLLNVRQLEVEI